MICFVLLCFCFVLLLLLPLLLLFLLIAQLHFEMEAETAAIKEALEVYSSRLNGNIFPQCSYIFSLFDYLVTMTQDPHVRKTAAICVAKLYDINPDLVEVQGFLDLRHAAGID